MVHPSDRQPSDDATAGAGAPAVSLWKRTEEIADRLRQADGIILLTDFDGSLAEITQHPSDAELPEATRTVLAELSAKPWVVLAVVTGRQLDDVQDLVDIENIDYATNHGLVVQHGEQTTGHPITETTRPKIDAICEALESRLDDIDGTLVEDKGATATIHYRRASAADVETVEDTVRTAVAEFDEDGEIRLTEGKQIIELRPSVDWDKGRAAEWLIARYTPDGEHWLPIYIGDDVSDEDAFLALGEDGITVRVGGDPDQTAAEYQLQDPHAVRDFLDWLTEHGPK